MRWVAIRHGDDHIHIVAMLARQDGRRPRVDNDRYRVREACLAAEQRYGLRRTAPGDRTAACRPSRAESEKAARRGLVEAPRITLRRHVSTAAAARPASRSSSPGSGESGVLVRIRQQHPRSRSGHRVRRRPARRHRRGRGAGLVRGREARRGPDLAEAAPPLGAPGSCRDEPFTAAERGAVWDHVARVADEASGQIRVLAEADPASAADAAWAAAGTLHVAAAALGSRILRQAADAYDRAGRTAYGRIPPPTAAGDSLRRAARLLAAYGYVTSDPSFRPIVLITRLAALAEAVAVLRQAQEHAAQAASALRAAERLHAAGRAYGAQPPEDHRPVRTAAALAEAGFPVAASPSGWCSPRLPLRSGRRGTGPPPTSPNPAATESG